jgi:hypothetical protein
MKLPCILLVESLYVDGEGDYLTCSMYLKRKLNFGNVKNTKITSVNRKKQKITVKKHPMCKKCDILKYTDMIRPIDLKTKLKLARLYISNKLKKKEMKFKHNIRILTKGHPMVK